MAQPIDMYIDKTRRSCVPHVLAILFGITYTRMCRRLLKAGIRYDKVPSPFIEKLLDKKFGIEKIIFYEKPRKLSYWIRDKKRTWVLGVCRQDLIYHAAPQHCMILHEGKIIDNHSGFYGLPFDDGTARVFKAWQLAGKFYET